MFVNYSTLSMKTIVFIQFIIFSFFSTFHANASQFYNKDNNINKNSSIISPKDKKEINCKVCIYQDIDPLTGLTYKCNKEMCDLNEALVKFYEVMEKIHKEDNNAKNLLIKCQKEIAKIKNNPNYKVSTTCNWYLIIESNEKDFNKNYHNIKRCGYDSNGKCENLWKNNCKDEGAYDASINVPLSEVINDDLNNVYEVIDSIMYDYESVSNIKTRYITQSRRTRLVNYCNDFNRLFNINSQIKGCNQVLNSNSKITLEDYKNILLNIYKSYMKEETPKLNYWSNIDSVSNYISNWRKEKGCTRLDIEPQDHSNSKVGLLLSDLALNCYDEECSEGEICVSSCSTFQNIGKVIDKIKKEDCEVLRRQLGSNVNINLTGNVTFVNQSVSAPSYTISITENECRVINNISCKEWEGKLCLLDSKIQENALCQDTQDDKKLLVCVSTKGSKNYGVWQVMDIDEGNKDKYIDIDPNFYSSDLSSSVSSETSGNYLLETSSVTKSQSRTTGVNTSSSSSSARNNNYYYTSSSLSSPNRNIRY